MTGFSVHADLLWRTGRQYEYVRRRLEAVFTGLVDGLGSLGDFCGKDEVGEAFAAQYCPSLVRLQDQLSWHMSDLHSLVDRMDVWARSYPTSDDVVAGGIQPAM